VFILINRWAVNYNSISRILYCPNVLHVSAVFFCKATIRPKYRFWTVKYIVWNMVVCLSVCLSVRDNGISDSWKKCLLCMYVFNVRDKWVPVTVTSGSRSQWQVGPCHSDKWVPVTTAWRFLRLQMEKWPPDIKGSCEYIEYAVADSRLGMVLQLGGCRGAKNTSL
jgi:hypothetical protein